MMKLLVWIYRRFLYFLARKQLKKSTDALVIAITGSSGKTSCKEMIAAFLKPHVPDETIFSSQGDASAVGISYEILGIRNRRYSILAAPFVLLYCVWKLLTNKTTYDIFLFEAGVNNSQGNKNLQDILSIIHPHIGVVISADIAHVEQKIKESTAMDMFQLIQSLQDRSRGFVCEEIVPYLPQEGLRKVRVIGTNQDFERIEGGNNLTGYHAIFRFNNKRYIVDLPGFVISSQATRDFEVASKIIMLLKFDLDKSFRFLNTFLKKEPGRASILSGIKNSVIIDSSLNATYDSARTLLQTLKEVTRQKRRRRVVVLGDLLEGNALLQKSHEDIVTDAVKIADLLILTNEIMLKHGVPKAKELGFTINENLFWFKNGRQLSYHIKNLVKEDDVILFEGSGDGVFLEFAVEELLEKHDPEYLEATLPRMSAKLRKWKEKRSK